MTLLTGSSLQGGKYIIVQTLGQGGFGITYEAEQVALHRRVAIKEFFMKEYCDRDSTTSHVTLGTSEGSKDTVERFRMKFVREAQMIAALDNPHIIKIHDIFEENGTAYYVMPFLDGGSLADKVKQNGPMPEQEAIGYIKQIGDALDYLHKQNILHLDVKPSNVLLNAAGEAVLIDFGISKHYDEAGSQTSTTPVGISKGYAPMEQYQQGNMTKFSPATDVYSLGATLFFLLTGETPPDASEINEDGVPEISASISSSSRAAIEKAMSPKRKDRPQSIASFLSMLHLPEPAEDKREKRGSSSQAEQLCPEEPTVIFNQIEKSGNYPKTTSGYIKDNSHKSIRKKLVKGNTRRSHSWIWVLVVTIVVIGVAFGVRQSFPPKSTNTSPQVTSHAVGRTVSTFSSMSPLQQGTIYGFSEGEYWVDLGLSVKWAAYNLGTRQEFEPGYYFSWGETSWKSLYKWQSYKYRTSGTEYDYIHLSKYNLDPDRGPVDGILTLSLSDDAARADWKGGWRIPTEAELVELITKCKWTAATSNNVRGFLVRGPSGGSIFLPVSGYQREDSLENVGIVGRYWTSSLYEDSSDSAWGLSFTTMDGPETKSAFPRYFGLTIRPVIEK